MILEDVFTIFHTKTNLRLRLISKSINTNIATKTMKLIIKVFYLKVLSDLFLFLHQLLEVVKHLLLHLSRQ